MKKILQDLSLEELKILTESYGEKPYRAKQIRSALHSGRKISEITDISKDFRAKLLEEYEDEPVRIIKKLVSSDGTEKFLLELSDGNVIESVLMKYKYGNTQCISTQVGCRMNCAFCASGLNGLARNLSSGEIASEIFAVNREAGGNLENRKVTNVVLMGSGEPLDNYANVVKFLREITADGGINISQRNISLSTSGLVPEMYKFADEKMGVNLSVSLHNPFDEKRRRIMPVAKKYSVKDILGACSYYFEKTGRRYIFEYSLIKGENDTKECADELIRLLSGRPCHVNLIRLNEVKERNLLATDDKYAYSFLGLLEKGGLSASLRRRIGTDIDGACGQLRNRYIKEKSTVGETNE
ncbi:MAG: 23S rRNA (adenine(2503)-C(2))-methyltransferase RlmN [Christensenellaceae bacterium]|nr:23S rRNA (adenine(2503)-C(2))-methyltransferase RlmN [Christensenellaceae bacterium]MDD6927332.1 23S rRNA (adenine(2503)-C(2))-methyltransferase RlmN [bacterium]MDY2850700.1 23S rRNA (adenine(2503)-C(2))-methyltransferase RlmN [Christensenellaceae bacterium]